MLRISILLCFFGLACCTPPVSKSRKQIEEFKEYLEKSRTDDGVLLDSRMYANPKANVWENSGKYQGDMLLRDEQIEALVRNYAEDRIAVVVPNRRWPNALVPYDFAPNHFNAAQQRAIVDAINWVAHFSCVRFRRRTASDRHFMWITGRPTGCYAGVGFSAAHTQHGMNLAPSTPGQGCLHNIVIIHEILHILGFVHMQSAYERYNYVRINWNNIINGYAFAFYRLPRQEINLMGLPYEYQSCMHYNTHAFSRNGQPTITATRPLNGGPMGHMRYVTHLDWVRLRRYYNCPGAWSRTNVVAVEEEFERTKDLMQNQLPPPDTGNIDSDEDILRMQNMTYDEEDQVINNEEMANEEEIVNGVNDINQEDAVNEENNN